ncbi:hypothetical protein D3C74_369820 [compost metagenome]
MGGNRFWHGNEDEPGCRKGVPRSVFQNGQLYAAILGRLGIPEHHERIYARRQPDVEVSGDYDNQAETLSEYELWRAFDL